MAVGLLQRKGVLSLSQGRERRNQGHGSKAEGRPLGGRPACLGPGSPGEGLSTGAGGGHSLLRFRVRPAPATQPSWPPLAAAHNGCPCSRTQPWPLCILP